MKRIHQFTIISVLVLTACCLLLFAGCKEDDAGKATASPSAAGTTTPTPVPTAATQKPATETPSAAPQEKNLIYYAIEDDASLLGGDSWAPIEGAWSGPLYEKRGSEDYTKQEFVEETLSDGTEGTCYHYFSDSTTGYHVSANTFGIMDVLDENKSYQLTISLKYTVPNPGAERDNLGVGCNIGNTPTVKVNSSEDWQTVTYSFQTGSDVENAYIYIGPYGATMDNGLIIGEIQAGFDLLIENISLVEVQ